MKAEVVTSEGTKLARDSDGDVWIWDCDYEKVLILKSEIPVVIDYLRKAI